MGILSNIGNFVQNRRRENEEVEMGRAIRKTEQEKLARARLQERLSVHKAHATAMRDRVSAEKEIRALKQEERNLKYAKVNAGISKVKTFLKEHKAKKSKHKQSMFTSGGGGVRPTGIFANNPTSVSGIAHSFGGTSPFVHQERTPTPKIHRKLPKLYKHEKSMYIITNE